MTTPLHVLFQPEAMGALVERFANQSENQNFIKVYQAGEPIQANVDGTFRYEQLDYSQDLAPITGMDSPSTGGIKRIRIPKTGTVLAIKQHVDLPARFLMGWRAPGQEGPNAAAVIAGELQQLTNKVMATLNYWAAKSLLTSSGAVDFSSFPNSDLAVGSETYPVKAISASNSWATASTKIRSAEINPVKKTYFQTNGFHAREAIASSAIEGYLTGNTEISNFINGGTLAGQILGRSFAERGIGDAVDFGGLSWQFVEDYYATEAAPTTPVTLYPDADSFALLPGRQMWRDVFGMVEGVQFIPTGVDAGAVLAAPDNIFTPRRGFGAFVTRSATGLQLHVFWTGYLVQKHPSAVAVVNTTP